MFNGMKTILLAAGRSKRLKPLGDKNFLNFLGKPLLQWQLEQLYKAGFKDVVVVGGAHNLEEISGLIKNVPNEVTVVEQENLNEGMAGAVLAAKKMIAKKEPVLIVSGNDVIESSAFEQIMAAHRVAEHGLLLAKEVDAYFPGGYLKTDEDFFCKNIVEKPGKGNEPSNLVNIVVHYFGQSGDLFKTLEEIDSKNDDRYESALAEMMNKGARIRAIPYEGFWKPVKYPWHVLDLTEHFLKTLSEYEIRNLENTGIEIADTATVKGGVYLEDGVKILDNAVVAGPAYIGRNTVIATNALVRNSHIGDNCVIGFGTEVARSYVGNCVWTHSNYIGDSIIGDNCSFGAGTVTGNLRLDEAAVLVNVEGSKVSAERNKLGLIMGSGVRCGINTSFMPGVKIGRNSMVGAGIVVAADVEEGKYVYGKTELIVKDNTSKLSPAVRAEMQKKLKSI